jgi:hypothetical protein
MALDVFKLIALAPLFCNWYKLVLMGFYGWQWLFYDGDQLVLMGPDGPQWLFWLMMGTNWS